VSTIWQTLGTTFQPILISLATIAVLALLRLITPTARWTRRLKRDGEIYAALPDGKEKAMWGESVTAQAERLRIYREDLSIGDQIFGWYAFLTLVSALVALIWDAFHEWSAVSLLGGDSPWTAIPGALLLVLNLAFALYITVRLISGRSISLHAGSGGHFPKYDTLRRMERRRRLKRSSIENRLAQRNSSA
jgi:hypothetical protein